MLDKLLKKEDVLRFVQTKGPLIPSHLIGLLQSNTIMIGAALSELSSDGNVKISHMKVGGSPLYFLDEQKVKLQDFYKYLNEKDRRTFDLLKQQKVLRDSEVTPLLRVSLRNIKDFAVPVEIEHNGSKELFWRWYLTDKQEAISLIRGLLGLQIVKKKVEENKVKDKFVEKKVITENIIPSQPVLEQKILRGKEELKREEIVSSSLFDKKKELETKIERESEKENIVSSFVEKKEQKEQRQIKKKQIETITVEKQTVHHEQFIQPSKEQTILLSAQTLLETSTDSLLLKCKQFFSEKNIHVKELTIIKKEKEITAVIALPSAIGEIIYFCAMKQKKKVNENELASIYLEAQNKKLPAFVLIQGDFTKKAYEKAAEQFVNMKLHFFS